MTRNQKRILAIIAIVFVVFSVISFALPFKKNGLFFISYLFGALAIVGQVYVEKIAFDVDEHVKSIIYGLPIARVGVIYMIAQLILSLAFMAFADIAPIWIAVIIYVLILAAGAVGFIGADAMKEKIEKQEVKFETDTACMMKLRAATDSLPGKCGDVETKRMLSDLAEAFRYSDPVSSDALKNIEAELEAGVCELKEAVERGNSDEISKLCSKAVGLLEERNRLCKRSKRR